MLLGSFTFPSVRRHALPRVLRAVARSSDTASRIQETSDRALRSALAVYAEVEWRTDRAEGFTLIALKAGDSRRTSRLYIEEFAVDAVG